MSVPAAGEASKTPNENSQTKQAAGSVSLTTRMDPSSPSDFSLDSGFDSPSSSFPSSPESWHLQGPGLCNIAQQNPLSKIPDVLTAQLSHRECARLIEEQSTCSEHGPSTSLCASETLSQCSSEAQSLLIDGFKVCDEQLYVQCEWSTCEKLLSSDNELYDHVVAEHIAVLQDLKRDNEENADCEGTEDTGEDDRFECKWGRCEMNITRGDDSKKFEWLREHFASRHVPHAQTFFCLYGDCKSRFSGKRALQDHLRLVHDRRAKPVKRSSDQTSAAQVQVDASCMVWSPNLYSRPKVFPDHENDFLDLKTMSWVYAQTVLHSKMHRPMFVAANGTHLHNGAKYRKTRRMTNYALIKESVPCVLEKAEQRNVSKCATTPA